MEKLSKDLTKIIQTKYKASFIPLPLPTDDSPLPIKSYIVSNYAAYRFYKDPPGVMTLMCTVKPKNSVEPIESDVILSCIKDKDSGVWIARQQISKYEWGEFGEETAEYEAFELLLKDNAIQSN